MNVAFLNARTADTYKLRFSTQFVDSTTAGQTHTGAQAAHLLVNDLFQATFISYATFDTFRHQFVGSVIALEITVRGTFGHRAQGTHTTVRFVRTALVEFDFTRRFFSTRQHGTYHHRACASGDSFGDVAGEANTTICDNRNTGAFQGFNCVSNGSDLRNTYASNDTSRTDRTRADTDFNRAATSFCQSACTCSCCHVAADDLQIRIFSTGFTDTLQNAF